MALPTVSDYGDRMAVYADDSPDAPMLVEGERVAGTRSGWTVRWRDGAADQRRLFSRKDQARRIMRQVAAELLRKAATP